LNAISDPSGNAMFDKMIKAIKKSTMNQTSKMRWETEQIGVCDVCK
jgi:hypothetical protein